MKKNLSDIWQKYKRWLLITAILAVIIPLYLIIASHIFLLLLGIHSHTLNPLTIITCATVAWADASLRIKWLLAIGLPGIAALLLYVFATQEQQHTLFGRAHWASMIEAKKAGLFAKKGILLAKKWGEYLRIDGFEHVFVFAPSGSGKSTALVIPNLLTWDGSCIVQDVKLTLFQLTSRYRASHGQDCYVWNPGTRDGYTHCYNPLDWVNPDPILRIDDLQKIAHSFIPDHPKQDPIWTTQPRMLFVALALYLLDTKDCPKTLGELTRLVKNSPNFSAWLSETINKRNDLDPLCYRNFNNFLQTEHRLQTNILQSFISYFELFDNPLIDAATSKSDFDITALRKTRMTIYVGVTPDNLVRLSPLLTVFYQQVLDALLRQIPDTSQEPHGVLLLLDEFSALRRMEVLQKNIGLMREYRLRMMIIIQDLPQLYSIYGHDGGKAFINNKIRIAFAQNDLDAAKLISGWVGEKTVQHRTQNQGGFKLNTNRESISYTKRELIKPEEIMQLAADKAIIIVEGSPPILAHKNFWYKDSQLKQRVVGEIKLPKIDPVLIQYQRSQKNAAENKEKPKKTKLSEEENL